MPKQVSTEIKKRIGERLKRLLDNEGISAHKLSLDLDVGYTTINRIVNGVGAPGIDLLVAIADYFEVSTDYLLGRKFKKNT